MRIEKDDRMYTFTDHNESNLEVRNVGNKVRITITRRDGEFSIFWAKKADVDNLDTLLGALREKIAYP